MVGLRLRRLFYSKYITRHALRYTNPITTTHPATRHIHLTMTTYPCLMPDHYTLLTVFLFGCFSTVSISCFHNKTPLTQPLHCLTTIRGLGHPRFALIFQLFFPFEVSEYFVAIN
jgi:hypothetical protein